MTQSPAGTQPAAAAEVLADANVALENDLIASYLYLRRGIGIIGLALPFFLVIGHDIAARKLEWRGSISGYYYTDMRNVLVGSMCAVGVFLFCYKYDFIDNILSNIAGVCAVLVALCPTMSAHPSHVGNIVGYIHYGAAFGLFLLLAWFCIWLFTRSDPGVVGPPTARKLARNRIYRLCGIIIIIASILAGVSGTGILSESFRNHLNPLLWCEWVAITAFGVAWLVKGETLLKD